MLGSITLVLTLTALGLSRWQFQRLATRKAINAALIAAGALPPLDLVTALRAGTPLVGRRVRTTGTFDTTGQLLLRNRVENDGPGLQVATAFHPDSTAVVLWVERGFVPSPDAVTPPDTIRAPASGDIAITGLMLAPPVALDANVPLVRKGITTWMRLDSTSMHEDRAGALGLYLLLVGDTMGPGRLTAVPPPALDNGPHLSYAIQWIGIALAIASFGIMVLWRENRGRAPHPSAP
jgi:cytochrome oxidase assembly protein ShyY1